MTPERHQFVCDLLYQALELDASQRDAFLNRVCSSDPSLRRELDSLLSSSEDVRSTFMRSSTLRMTLAPGTQLGDYDVDSLLGSGAMGEVYRARDRRLGRNVAIKVLPSYLSSDAKLLSRFEQEARAAAALNHPNILAVFQMGEHEGAPYLVSELLEGETLRDLIRRGQLPRRQAIDFAIQIGNGLIAAHGKGVVHRDLKPENLFVTRDGRVKILDFGLAKLTQSPSLLRSVDPSRPERALATEPGVIMGTLGYMAPEQARGQPADARSDIFSTGAVLYEMLTGKHAFQRGSAADTISAILNEPPPALSRIVPKVPVALQRVLERCLQKNPAQRFQSASDLVHELEIVSAGRRRASVAVWALAFAAVAMLALLARGKSLKDFMRRFQPRSVVTVNKVVERNLTANAADNPVRAAAISRDGKYVAYTDNSKSVTLLLVESGEVRQLPVDSSYQPAAWFPDGIHLLMEGSREQPGLWTFSNWDSSVHKVWDRPVGDEAVSPDGSRIALIDGRDHREIWLMGAGGEEPRKILEADAQHTIWNIAWSPNGHRLAFTSLRGTFAQHETVIETADLQGGHRSVVVSDPMLFGRDGIAGLAWLADGRILYAVSTKQDEYNLVSIKTNPETGEAIGKATLVTNWIGYSARAFQAAADGKRLVALKRHSEDGIYLGSLEPKNQRFTARRLLEDRWQNAATAWTSDSKTILLFSKRNGRWTIFKQDLNGDSLETLISGPENYRDPVVSSAGTLLYTVFTSGDVETSAGNWRLMSTPIAGGPRSVLMNGRYSYGCGSLPSSPCVVSDLQNNELIVSNLDPVHGKGEEITRIAEHAEGPQSYWSLSADGSRIAIADQLEPRGVLRILDLRTRKVTQLHVKNWKWQAFSYVGWAADGKRLFAVAFSPSSWALVSVAADGSLQVLYEVAPEQAWLGMPLASPDGRFLAFTKRAYMSDLVMLENF